jgi:hypothetical protein
MRGPATCPRCGSPLARPGIWSSQWTCPQHGAVVPMLPIPQPSLEWARHIVTRSPVPVWLPWPLPYAWLVTGLFVVGDDVTGIKAAATALSGPDPIGGPGDLLIVSEEPGVGLGARYAGVNGPDPGDQLHEVPDTKILVRGRPAPLWFVPGLPDRAAYVGESEGLWLWMVLHPETTDLLLLEELQLVDMRELGEEIDLVPFGALSPWLQSGG